MNATAIALAAGSTIPVNLPAKSALPPKPMSLRLARPEPVEQPEPEQTEGSFCMITFPGAAEISYHLPG